MWEIDVSDQAVTFLYSLLLGALLCVLYDIFRALRAALPHKAVAVFAEDILFWLISALVTFMFLMGRTGGGIRGYVLAAALAGFFIFRLTLSVILMPALSAVFSLTVKAQRFLNDRTARIFEFCGRFLSRFGRFFAKKSKTTVKTLKKLLKSVSHLLYTEKNTAERGEENDVC